MLLRTGFPLITTEPDKEYPMFVHPPMDFEQTNFDQFISSDIAQQYLVSPKRAAATTARRMEVTLRM
jgi:hypothetical protein